LLGDGENCGVARSPRERNARHGVAARIEQHNSVERRLTLRPWVVSVASSEARYDGVLVVDRKDAVASEVRMQVARGIVQQQDAVPQSTIGL